MVLPCMAGYGFVMEVEGDDIDGCMKLYFLPHQMMGDGIEMLVILDMVIHIDLDRFDVSVLVSLTWQGLRAGLSSDLNHCLRVPSSFLKTLLLTSSSREAIHRLSSASVKKLW